jgi:hypothetical protein
VRSNDRNPALEFLKQRFAAGDIDAEQFEQAAARMMGASSEAELAEVVRSVPSPVALTAPERRLERPLEINGGMGRLRLGGRWQVARETHVSAQLGGVILDLTDAEFDDRVVDLHVYTGWGAITIIVPRGVAVQVVQHRGNVDLRLDGPVVPGLQLVRLDATTNIGRVHLVHPDSQRARRLRGKSAR